MLVDFLSRPNPAIASINLYAPRTASGQIKAQPMLPRWPSREYPSKIPRLVQGNVFSESINDLLWVHQRKVFSRYGRLCLRPFGLHPRYRFIYLITISSKEPFPEELKWFFQYSLNLHTIAIEISTAKMSPIISKIRRRIRLPTLMRVSLLVQTLRYMVVSLSRRTQSLQT